MTVIALVSVLVCVLGLLLWVLPLPPKVQEAGKIMFAAGLLASLLAVAGKAIKLP